MIDPDLRQRWHDSDERRRAEEKRLADLRKRGPVLTFPKETDMEPTEHIIQFFAFDHLPEKLRDVSRPFGDLAAHIVAALPRNPERTVALRKLLEAKDAAVRALVAKV